MTIEIVDLAMKNGDFPVRYVSHYQVGYQFSKAFLTTVPRFVESSEVGTITTLWNLGRGIGCWVIFIMTGTVK